MNSYKNKKGYQALKNYARDYIKVNRPAEYRYWGLMFYNAQRKAQKLYNTYKPYIHDYDGKQNISFSAFFYNALKRDAPRSYSEDISFITDSPENNQRVVDAMRFKNMSETYSEVNEIINRYMNGELNRDDFLREIRDFRESPSYNKIQYNPDTYVEY